MTEQRTDFEEFVKGSLTDIKGSIDKLVTRAEFNATIERIDSQHNQLDNRVAEIKSDADRTHESLTKDWQNDFSTFKIDTANNFTTIKSDTKNRFDSLANMSRWLIALIISSAVGVAAILVKLHG